MAEFLIYIFPKLIFILPFLKENYSLVCHQDPHKLIAEGNCVSLVCSRCAGIYLGALAASIVNLFWPKKITISTKLLILSSIPMFLDVFFVLIKLYNYSKIIAFLTGILFGVISFLYFYSALLELIHELRDKKK